MAKEIKTPMKQYLDFSVWLIEESKEQSFKYLGDGQFRYGYLSPYSIEELFDIYKQFNPVLPLQANIGVDEEKLRNQQQRQTFDM